MGMSRRHPTAPLTKIAFPNHNCMRVCLLLLALATSRPIFAAEPPTGDCPQPRITGQAPAEYLARTNPLANDPETLAAGETIYIGKSRSVPCAICHGIRGPAIFPASPP
jgi:mono/diheme cytochrome c family protein